MAKVILSESPRYADDDSGLSLQYFCQDLEFYHASRRHKFVQVDHYKEKGKYDHEFLVFEITHEDYKSDAGKDNIYLRMERRPSGQSPLHAAGSFQRVTNDTIKRVRPGFDCSTYYHLFTVSRHPTNHCSLADICKMYEPIRIMSPTYDPVQHNCYWFCNKLLQSLAERMQVNGCPQKDYALRSTFAVGFTRVYPSRFARQWPSHIAVEDSDGTPNGCMCLPVMMPWKTDAQRMEKDKQKSSTSPPIPTIVTTPADDLITQPDPALSIVQDTRRPLIEEKVGVGTGTWSSDEAQLQNLESALEKKVSWQHEAIESVAHAVRLSTTTNKSDANRPIASLLFAGPEGRGQRDVVGALAEELFGDSSLMIEITKIKSSYFGDEIWFSTGCSLRRESHFHYNSFTGGHLSGFVLKNPCCCVLVTESLENMSPKILKLFFEILHHGELHDQGEVVNFRNTVLVMTTGVADRLLESQVGDIPEGKRRKIDETIQCDLGKAVQVQLGPEHPFVDWSTRFTIAPFRALWNPDVKRQVIQKEVQDLQVRTEVTINVNIKAEQWLMKRGISFEHGTQLMSDIMSERLLHRMDEGDIKKGDKVEFRMNARSNRLRVVVPNDDLWSRFISTLAYPLEDSKEVISSVSAVEASEPMTEKLGIGPSGSIMLTA